MSLLTDGTIGQKLCQDGVTMDPAHVHFGRYVSSPTAISKMES